MLQDVEPELHTVPPDRGDMESQPKWRQDFPIDTPQDGYVARRDFTKFLGLTSLAFVVGQFWIAVQNRRRLRRGELPLTAIVPFADLAVGETKMFHYPTDSDTAILLRPTVNTLLAFGNQCTHLQCPVIPDIKSGHFHCPCHAGYFDLKTGEPIAGPPRRPLPRIKVEVRHGTVYASGYEEST